jgi:hypothetical protein
MRIQAFLTAAAVNLDGSKNAALGWEGAVIETGMAVR